VSKSVLLIAGEVSGDMHAAGLVRAVKRRNPEVEFFGIGGDELRAAGMEIVVDARDMAVMGLVEVIERYGFFKQVFTELIARARGRKPDAVVLVDYPGFNLRFAEKVREMGIKVVYYICPQVWAWRRSRIRKMARIVNRLIVIFPFEPDVFKDTGLKVDFVGHPLVEVAKKALAEPLKDLPWNGEPKIALLPGSRRQEIERILPSMVSAAALLKKKNPGTGFIVASPSDEIAGSVRDVLSSHPDKAARCKIVVGDTRQILRQARAAMVASGTATIETALMGCPMIVVYKMSPITYFLGRLLVKVPNIGMVNVVAGRRLCPELIQGAATPEALASAMYPLIEDTSERATMRVGLEEVRRLLGQGGAAEKAAGILLEELG
jgi:lipid-A-disaccharide synthase